MFAKAREKAGPNWLKFVKKNHGNPVGDYGK